MIRLLRFLVVMALLTTTTAFGGVERHTLTSAIDNREPVDDLGNEVSMPDDTLVLYYFTHITDMANQQIVHRWFYNGSEMATVSLNIGSNSWRTYSSKKILPQWTGQWTVQVWHNDLQLTEHSFSIQ